MFMQIHLIIKKVTNVQHITEIGLNKLVLHVKNLAKKSI